MPKLNEKIKDVRLVEVLILIILSFLALSFLKLVSVFVDYNWVYILLIFYFVYKLRACGQDFKLSAIRIFEDVSFKTILGIVIANIFFSYGMLYLTNFLLSIPLFNSILNLSFAHKVSWVLVGGLLSKLIIAPISEELLFRGLFLNKLRLIVPLSFAIIISSFLFGAFHSLGSIISAIVFACCMCILYLKTNNILVPIFAHFLNNFLAEIIFTLDASKAMFRNDLVVGCVSVLAIVSLFLIIRYISKQLNSIKYC